MFKMSLLQSNATQIIANNSVFHYREMGIYLEPSIMRRITVTSRTEILTDVRTE